MQLLQNDQLQVDSSHMIPDVLGTSEVHAGWVLMCAASAGALGAAINVARWNEQRDSRELIRLDLVGLASELATVAGRIHEDLPRASGDVEVEELRSRCLQHRDKALALLSRETRFERLTDEALLEKLRSFRDEHEQLMQLWDDAERLILTWDGRSLGS